MRVKGVGFRASFEERKNGHRKRAHKRDLIKEPGRKRGVYRKRKGKDTTGGGKR